MRLPLAEIAQQRTVRLIAAKYYDPPVLVRIADGDVDLHALDRLQAATGRAQRRRPPNDTYDDWGDLVIRAAFLHTRPGGNRFNDGDRGAWYAAFDERTALSEVGFHKTRELRNIGYYHDTSRFRAVHASFIGRFHDLRGADPVPDVLHEDPDVGYPHGQALARQLRALEPPSRGLIYPSVRNAGGTCLVAFQPNAVQDVHPGPEWEIRWEGSPHCYAVPV